MRYKLLEYCLNPEVASSNVRGLDIPDLERIAFQADRQRVSPPDPFESWFELDVYLRISRREYRVIPQFEVHGYHIDLVVQGMDGSLAVECDGDVWHSVARYDDDAARQRDLERCGWTFFRVRESAFRLDQEEALSGLWQTLERHRIFPVPEEKIRHGKTENTEDPPSVEDETADPTTVHDSAEAQVLRRNDSHATKPTARSEHRIDPPWVAEMDTPGTIGQPDQESSAEVHQESDAPGRENSSPDQFELLRDEPVLTNAPGVDGLAPYVEWIPTAPVPDPRTANQVQLVDLITEVVGREGPIVAIRAYRLINRASGSLRLTKPARRALNRACAAAVRNGVMIAADPLNRDGQAHLVLRSPESPEVILRERGRRELDELPPDEIAMLLRFLREAADSADDELLKRHALASLEWVRLTRNVSDFLDRCIELSDDRSAGANSLSIG